MGMTGMIDGTQMYHDAIKRIQQLEKLNATLAAEIDRMRPVVEATVKQIRRDDDRFSWSDLKQAVDTYEGVDQKRNCNCAFGYEPGHQCLNQR